MQHLSNGIVILQCVRTQNALTLISDIVEESDFSDTADNSTYVSDVQSLITKSILNSFSAKMF